MTTPAIDMLDTAELGELLSGLARSVVQAQDQLDIHASRQATEYAKLPDGTLAIPPLWYTVKNAVIDVEMAGVIQNQQIICRLLNPAGVALFGYQASSGVRVRIAIGPSAIMPVKVDPKEHCGG
jgi:hypothetical protein